MQPAPLPPRGGFTSAQWAPAPAVWPRGNHPAARSAGAIDFIAPCTHSITAPHHRMAQFMVRYQHQRRNRITNQTEVKLAEISVPNGYVSTHAYFTGGKLGVFPNSFKRFDVVDPGLSARYDAILILFQKRCRKYNIKDHGL